MSFEKTISRFFKESGAQTSIHLGQMTYNVKAIIQPMRYKNKLYIELGRTELGFKDSECFLYLGPSDVDFSGAEMETYITTADRSYNVSRADRIMLGEKVAYIWAVLTPRIKDGIYEQL